MNIRNQKREKNNESGFTIIELMIATGVFSVVLLLCATAVIQVGRIFYKGTIVNKTQNTSRSIIDDVTQAIQFGGSTAGSFYQTGAVTYTFGTQNIPVSSVCLGDIRYSYVLRTDPTLTTVDFQLPHVFWKDRRSGAACTPRNITSADFGGAGGGTSGQELLDKSMNVSKFVVTQPTTGATLWKIELTATYGATYDLFTDSNFDVCKPNRSGGQFCAVSTITTYATRRL
jgi:prepilin-type N-terminal cleavage/methylation domain-containing protein